MGSKVGNGSPSSWSYLCKKSNGSTVLLLLLASWVFLVVAMWWFYIYAQGDRNEELSFRRDRSNNNRINLFLDKLTIVHAKHSEISVLLTNLNRRLQNVQPKKKNRLVSSLNRVMDKVGSAGRYHRPLFKKEGDVLDGMEPSEMYEVLRRRILSNVQDLWFYLHSHLQKLSSTPAASQQTLLNDIIRSIDEYKRSLLVDVTDMSKNDGYTEWRERQHHALSDLVQRRLEYLQNPPSCKTAKKLVCDLNKGCGFGCQLHHAVYCLILAYGTERTLIMKSKGWRYSPKLGWQSAFLPISNTCLSTEGEPRSNWPGTEFTQVVDLPIIDSLSPRPPYLPLKVPEDLAPILIRVHGDPIVWWIGQFVKFIMRYQPSVQKMLQERNQSMDFQNPIVGIHVRRTDKIGTEAAYHKLEEYMLHAEQYFKQLEFEKAQQKRKSNGEEEGRIVRRVYIATDDPQVLAEARVKYPDYRIIGNESVSKTAASSKRYSMESLNGIISDLHFLAHTDHLVCTFSSQVCRVAYEIMNSISADSAYKYSSLDDIYYYGGQEARYQVAVLPHRAFTPHEIDLMVGDVISVAGNHWNGFSKGRNMRTYKVGLYPSFKVLFKVETAKFPTYKQAEIANV